MSPADSTRTALAPPAALTEAADALVQAVDHQLLTGGIESVPAETIQQLLALSVKLYAARRAAGADIAPTPGVDSVNGTEVAVVTTALLETVNLDLFELSLWRQWGRA
jgi:hypothetical protein